MLNYIGNYFCVFFYYNEMFLDHAYLTGEAEMLIPTAWIPLLNTNRSNGCMEVSKNTWIVLRSVS